MTILAFMSKEIRINVRTTAQIKRDVEIAARLKGLSVSGLVNSAVVRAIREEKERDPAAFASSGVKFAGVASGGAEKKERKAK